MDHKHLMIFNNTNIREEKIIGMVYMTDMWKATGSNDSQQPNSWLRLPRLQKFYRSPVESPKSYQNQKDT